jgi:hypothetical protein
MSGYKNPVFLLNTVELLLASEKKPEPMERTIGVYSESISSKKYSNSQSPNQKTLGKLIRK